MKQPSYPAAILQILDIKNEHTSSPVSIIRLPVKKNYFRSSSVGMHPQGAPPFLICWQPWMVTRPFREDAAWAANRRERGVTGAFRPCSGAPIKWDRNTLIEQSPQSMDTTIIVQSLSLYNRGNRSLFDKGACATCTKWF